jgi:hypothetical protein
MVGGGEWNFGRIGLGSVISAAQLNGERLDDLPQTPQEGESA